MPSLQISLGDWEIGILANEANDQMEDIFEKLPEKDRRLDKIQRIVASTVAAQIIRKALPGIEIKIAEAAKRRKEK